MNFKIHLSFLILFSSFLFAKIKGTVKNQSTNELIKGVNITAGELGTATNEFGEFNINVSIGTKLEFSHIGYGLVSQLAQNDMLVEMSPTVIKSKEIIVRAGLSDESLQKITSSVTVFTGNDIRESATDHFQTLIDQIPNLNWAGGTSRPRYFQIRGIGERSHYFGEGPPNFSVGFVMDDMDLSGMGMVGLLYDIDQIEVYKGPQSSIYGPNAMAGLISMGSTDPIDHFELKSSTNFGSDNHYGGSSVMNVRLMKNMNMRLTGIYNYSDGFRKNMSQNITDSNKREEAFYRMKLMHDPINKLSILATFIYCELENGYDAWAPDNNTDFKTFSNDKGEDSQRTFGYSLRANFEARDNLNITSISSFTETDLVHAYDGDWADSAYWHETHDFDPAVEGWAYEFYDKNERNRSNLTQEIRLSMGSIVMGGYFKHLIEQDEAMGYLYGGAATDAINHYDFLATAGYAQYEVDLTSSLKLKGNVRFENNSVKYEGTSQGLNDYWEKIELPLIHFDIDHSMLGYRASLHYLKDEFTSCYGSISQGYKSGGVNQQPYLTDASRPYDPEYIQNFEVGLKRTTDIYRTQLSAFYSLRKDQQVSVSTQQVDGDPNSFLFYTANAGSGSVQGFEWETNYQILSRISLNTSLGYLDTWIDKFTYQANSEMEGYGGNREAAMSPKVTGSFGVHFKNNSGIFGLVQMSFKDAYYFSDSHIQKSKPYTLLNMNVGKSFGKTMIKLWIRNALDERYTTRCFYFGLIPPTYPDQLWKSYGDPRQIGVTIDYTF